MAKHKKIQRAQEIKYSIVFPKAASPTSPKVFAPVILEQRHRRYIERSVVIAATTINKDPSTIPVFDNANGMLRTPPPMIDAPRLKPAIIIVDFREGEPNSGTRISEAVILFCFVLLEQPDATTSVVSYFPCRWLSRCSKRECKSCCQEFGTKDSQPQLLPLPMQSLARESSSDQEICERDFFSLKNLADFRAKK